MRFGLSGVRICVKDPDKKTREIHITGLNLPIFRAQLSNRYSHKARDTHSKRTTQLARWLTVSAAKFIRS